MSDPIGRSRAGTGRRRAADQHVPEGLEAVGELGRGANTVVDRVRRAGVDYALKSSLVPPTGGETPLAGFRREAALLARVDHPGIAQVHEVGLVDDRPYLVMDLIEGRRLTEVLRTGPLSESAALAIGVQMAEALAAAHRAGLVHRDIKPDNIMVDTGGTARLIDFGLAARTRGPSDSEGATGTLTYAAPEQSGMLNRPVDGRADLYALGVVLYECVTGQPPFTAADVGELLHAHAATPAPDPRSARPGLSPALAAIIGTLLAKDPDDRYQTGTGLADDLRLAGTGAGASTGTGAGFTPRGTDRSTSHGHDLPLAGWKPELTRLVDRWARSVAGTGGVALVLGPAGSGKTRLARELATRVAADGHLVLHGATSSDTSVPLAPIRSAIERHAERALHLAEPARQAALDALVNAAGPTASLLSQLSPALAAALGVASARSTDDQQEQFVAALADFFVALSRSAGGLLLYLDDGQHFDELTHQVLGRLAADLPSAPLLVLLTAREEAGEALPASLGSALDTTVEVARLDATTAAELIASAAGGIRIHPVAVDALVDRSGGNPFMLLEYLDAVVDAGLIWPDWGTWELDVAGLDGLALPTGAAELVVRRIEAIDTDGRGTLAAAAAYGSTFSADHLAAVTGRPGEWIRELLADAMRHRLVEARPGGRYAFLHECIREALLGTAEPDALRELHHRIAGVLAAEPQDNDEYVYAVAGHRRMAGNRHDPVNGYHAAVAAGNRALAAHAPEAASGFLEYAVEAATAGGLRPDPSLYRALGLAFHRTGRFADAIDGFTRALDATTDPLARGRILRLIARVHQSRWDNDEVLEAVRRALDEMGRPLPRNRFLLLLSTLGLFLAGYLVGRTGVGRGWVSASKRDLYRLLGSLYDTAAIAATRSLRPTLSMAVLLRAMYVVNRAGPGPENARIRANLGIVARAIGLRRVADRGGHRAATMAQDLGDRRVIAEVAYLNGFGRYNSGADAGLSLRQALDQHGRWLDAGDYVDGVSLLCWDHLLSGEVAEAEAWWRRGTARVPPGQQAQRSPFAAVEPALLAARGRFGEAAARLRPILDRLADDESRHRANILSAVAWCAMEQDDLPALRNAVAEIRGVGVPAPAMLPPARNAMLFEIWGRVEACRAPASGPQRAELLTAARQSVKALRPVMNRPELRAHLAVARAALRQAAGDHKGALDDLFRAERRVVHADPPRLAYEAARIRARAYRHWGREGESSRQARLAIAVATDHGWSHRARWITVEFGAVAGSHAGTIGSSQSYGGDTASAGLQRQRLSALQQVSQAASRVLDPDRLARIALDETVRILAAERAFMFRYDADADRLVPHLGRDSNGNDLAELTNYSTTMVDQARQTRQPQILTGDADGAAIGAHSVVVHGLRSIMVAPLELEGRLLGVVYLDSRVAKGIFTEDDVSILTAITNHIAVALETARAAQLEVAVATANQQRDVAEKLRAAMSFVSGSLDPNQVLDRLLTTVAQILGAQSAWLVARDVDEPGTVTVRADLDLTGSEPDKPHGERFAVDSDPVLAALLDTPAPMVGVPHAPVPATFEGVLPEAGTWLTVPLAIRDDRVGMLLLSSDRPDAFADAGTELAATLAGQGMVAYENARLFSTVRRLATTDTLTGVANRRHFFDLAEDQFAAASRTGTPLSTLMLDIDHFKRVNDTYGHSVGDEVIRTVARRLGESGRQEDLVGRYGGEEFGMVVAAPDDVAVTVAERIRRAVADAPVDTPAGPVPVSISVGVAHLVHDRDGALSELLDRADRGLYRAKEGGRNRVVAGTP